MTIAARRRSFNEAAHKLAGQPEEATDTRGQHPAVARPGRLDAFLAALAASQPPLDRVPGTAIFLSRGDGGTPPALLAEVQRNHALADKVLVVSVHIADAAHIDAGAGLAVHRLGSGRVRILHVTVEAGYADRVDVPAALHLARRRGLLERNLDLEHASYFTPPAAEM